MRYRSMAITQSPHRGQQLASYLLIERDIDGWTIIPTRHAFTSSCNQLKQQVHLNGFPQTQPYYRETFPSKQCTNKFIY